jgi:hypothetical protein
MYFDVYDYPKLIAAAPGVYSFGYTWEDIFKSAGFKTYRYDSHLLLCHWLDEHEFTWFVLRYS